MTTILPPTAVGLAWVPARDERILRSAIPSGFRSAADRVGFPAGMSVEDIDHPLDPDHPGGYGGSTSVVLRPWLADQIEIDAWVPRIEAAMSDIADEIASRLLARRRRIYNDAGPEHAAKSKEARANAVSMLDRYTHFVKDAGAMRELAVDEFLAPKDLKKLERLLLKNILRHQEQFLEFATTEADPDLDYLDAAFVEAAILKLTELDRDRSREPNKRGWGKRTTLGGHWCAGMLEVDRDIAIRAGRPLVARHLVQLRKLGIIPQEVNDGGVL